MIKYWKGLNKRERTIAAITGVVVVITVLFSAYNRAVDYLDRLDTTIENLETNLMQYTYQAARLEQVERDYSKVAGQHSSEWTQAEIHDRLRNEIHRLTFRDIPEEGMVPASGAQLVNIPSYPAGVLDEQGEGYREYRLRISTRPTTISNIARFLERLQQSDQLLRIERLELTRRNPEAAAVEADLSISRVVIDTEEHDEVIVTSPIIANLIRNHSFEDWNAEEERFAEWSGEQVTFEACDEYVTQGARALRAVGNGMVYQLQELDPGRTYDLALDVHATGSARLVVYNDTSDQPFDGGLDIEPNDGVTRYMARFTVPAGGVNAVRAPVIQLLEPGTCVTIDNVSLIPVIP